MSDICAMCQFCTYEDERPPEAYCHNQYSGNYGKLLKHVDTEKPGCIDFSPHIYKDLSLKEALRILTTETVGHNAYYELPTKDLPPFLCINFDGNSQMARWRDAHTRLFMEYIKMAKKDGDFEDGSTEE